MTSEGQIARRQILVIANPTAGSGGSARLEAVVDRLRDLGCSVKLHATEASGDAEQFVRNIDCSDIDAIVAAGGDGTVNEVLNGLPEDGPPLAILPLGTVNVLAREIALSRSIDSIAATIAFGPSRPVTIGEVNGRRFAMMASVGLDAKVVDNVSLGLKRYVGKWAYILETFRQIIPSTQSLYRVRIGDIEQKAHGVIIANGRHYGGDYVTSPAACLEKPALDVCRLTRPGRLAVFSYLTSLFLGRFAKRADVHIEEATDFKIIGPAGSPVQLDGDVLCRLPASVRVLPAAINLIYPASSEDGNPRPS
ncbi:MAG: diacylglycerol kinase family protein [Pseudomonadota bacterium]